MAAIPTRTTGAAKRDADDPSLYRTIWRWHFYAGLIILPVLLWLATTGAIYLYKPELEHRLYREWIDLPAGIRTSSIADLVKAVELQTRGRVVQIQRPALATESWRFTLAAPDGTARLAFVRPDTGLVLGAMRGAGPIDTVKQLHSLSVVGPIGNILVEIVAGWAIILVLTGFYLWWPRAGTKALSLAGRVRERRFWRNLHASVGLVVGVVILFLAVTGMPWTTFWGSRFHALVAAEQIGRPPAPQANGGGHGGHDEHLPWSLRGAAPPHATGRTDIGPDAVARIAQARGLAAPWVLTLPAGSGKPYRLAPVLDRAQDARVLYIEPASGKVLQDANWTEFGIGAKAFEWGIFTHQGQEYGELNRLVMLAGCVGVWLLAGSAPVLWWKRRRAGRLSAPPQPADRSRTRGVATIMLAIGALFPLTGLSMAAALLAERALKRMSARSRLSRS